MHEPEVDVKFDVFLLIIICEEYFRPARLELFPLQDTEPVVFHSEARRVQCVCDVVVTVRDTVLLLVKDTVLLLVRDMVLLLVRDTVLLLVRATDHGIIFSYLIASSHKHFIIITIGVDSGQE